MNTLTYIQKIANVTGTKLAHPEAVQTALAKVEAARQWRHVDPQPTLAVTLADADPKDWAKVAKQWQQKDSERQLHADSGPLANLVEQQAERIVIDNISSYYDLFEQHLTNAATAIASDVPTDPRAAVDLGRGDELTALNRGLSILELWSHTVKSAKIRGFTSGQSVNPRWASLIDSSAGPIPIERIREGTQQLTRDRMNPTGESARIDAAHALCRAGVNDSAFLIRVARGELPGLVVKPAQSREEVTARVTNTFAIDMRVEQPRKS